MDPNPDAIKEDLNRFRYSVSENFNKVQKLEEQVAEVEKFYLSTKAQVNSVKDKGREKLVIGSRRSQQGASSKEPNSSNAMQEIAEHKWAWPFLEPVDVEGLGLHDYHEIIAKPMDFSTIKKKMDAKDGSGYKNVREIYSDVRLIFKNAMKYNNEKHDIHIMAKSLLEKFEKKWLQLLPEVAHAESEQLKEEAHMQLEKQLAQEATYANMAKDISLSLCEVEVHLKNLKEMVIEKCRKISIREKLELVKSFSRLNFENLNKALQIISENDPTFKPNDLEVNLDLDNQTDYTVWKLNVFVKKALEEQGKNAAEELNVNHNVHKALS
ncbi:Transcription factor GTE1 Bromodomain-containing protein [Vigna angularis]|uniref:Transcription factor GTE1 Bromodomain-containing protein n=1 Tax=Phaseolus angularis TaxID=3914 RepID=A0A8T0KF29_PHAAN|nr:Transcription factor GTE1 Bromodomain-containing protein [Vigna angularis]